MAGLRFLVRLDFASTFSLEVGSMTEWIDDVFSNVLHLHWSRKANSFTVNQFLLVAHTI